MSSTTTNTYNPLNFLLMKKPTIQVIYNHSCSICRFEINHYKKIADSSLEWIDITNNNEALKLTGKSKSELLRRVHLINDDKLFCGAEAFIIIWSKMPKYRILSKILILKIFFYFFHYSYELVAYFLFLKNKNMLK